MRSNNLTLILGAQWGDEGKGKLVDILTPKFDIVARATGGANAGHTVYATVNNVPKKFIFHLLPSGLTHPDIVGVIGNGCVLHLPTLYEELENLNLEGISINNRLKISDRVALLFEYHKLIDSHQENSKGENQVGTTRRGIGPCYADKINRRGLRLCDLTNWDNFISRYQANLEWHQSVYRFEYDSTTELNFIRSKRDQLLEKMTDTATYLYEALSAGQKVLLEGANAALLDIDHGTYPYVTSSNPTIGGVFTGTGISPQHLGEIIGVVKSYMTRVGAGPFPTELENETGEQIRKIGGEYGSTTGRPRRCGWFDAPLTRYSIMLNGFTSLNLTKLDILDNLEEIKIATAYYLNNQKLERFPANLEDLAAVKVEYETLPGWKTSLQDISSWEQLPPNAQKYILRLEKLLNCPIKYIGVGQKREQIIVRTNQLS